MKRLMVFTLVAVLVIGLAVPAFAGGRRHRHGHATANIALGLAAFAVANQLIGGFGHPRPVVYERTIYVATPTQVIYSPAPQVVIVEPAPLPPVAASVVYYPHGRYELWFYGTHYQWVWIPR